MILSLASSITRFWTLQNVPAGVNLSVDSITFDFNNTNTVTLTFSYSGDFTSDWNLSIRGAFSVFSNSDTSQTFDPIPVQLPPASITLPPSAARVSSALSVTEGATATYDMQLGQQPQGSVVVQLKTPSGVSADPSGASVQRGELEHGAGGDGGGAG